MYSTRDVFDDTKVEFTKSIKETAKAAMKFIGTQELIPGKKLGVVLLQTEATPDPTKLVEIPDGTSKLPVDQRAMIVAKRLEKADLRDPLFWSHLTVSRRNKQVVVALNNTKDGYIITADKDFATERGISPEALADALIATIRTSVDPGPEAHTRDLVADDALTPAERLARANQLKQLADDAYGQKDMAKAERNYQHAIRLAPDFAVPYIRLAALYMEQGDKSKAQDILAQAQQVKSLNDQQKREISVLAKRAK